MTQPVRITSNVYIRRGPSRNSGVLGIAPEGRMMEMDGTVTAESYKGINTWYFKLNSKGDKQYYWGGCVAPDQPLVATATPPQGFDVSKTSWAFSLPDGLDITGCWNKGLMGQNVKIAILDSGINLNIKDLSNAIKDPSADVKSFVSGDDTVTDDFGHGTNCASVAAARGENIFGAAPRSSLVIAKIRTANTLITPEATLAALQWACETKGADVVSMSFSGTIADPATAAYISSRSKPPFNKIFIASVDDIGSFDPDTPYYPANYPGCISTGSYTTGRTPCSTSGWNKQLFFISPGDKLRAYDKDGNVTTLECGTSYACPFTAGAIACILSHYKNNNLPYNAAEVTDALVSSAEPPAGLDPLQTGKGIINIGKVLSKLNIT